MITRQEQLTADIAVILDRIKEIHSKELLLRNDLRNNVLDRSRFANELELVKETRRRMLQKEETLDESNQSVCTHDNNQRNGQLNGNDESTSVAPIASSSSFSSFALSLSSLQAKLSSSFPFTHSFSSESCDEDRINSNNNCCNDYYDSNNNGGFHISSSTPLSPKKSHYVEEYMMQKEDGIAKIDMEIEELQEALVQLTIRIEEGKQSKILNEIK